MMVTTYTANDLVIPVPLTNENIIVFFRDDPMQCGFAAIRAAHPGEDGVLITAALSTTGPGSGNLPGDPITPATLFGLITAAEYVQLTTSQFNQLAPFFSAPANIDIGDAENQGKLNFILADKPDSLLKVQGKYTKTGSAWFRFFGSSANGPSLELLDAARNQSPGNNF